ncbi:MAG: hypothetical protein EPN76_11970 [Burkholderiaceae bacterium]|nr:MAG: hypothetical protein EPN76_11970 [Burkholderiaceae bacterium]TAM00533.1 MAG: hypothetical protein EPN67_14220 [Pusillimonas sp.]
MKLAYVFAAAVLAAVSVPSFAQTTRIHGQVEGLTDSVLTVKANDGSVLKVKLADGTTFSTMAAASLADITPGKYVGTAAHPGGPNGELVALEVHIFADSMRGVGEGHRPMQKENTMTNATVEDVVTGIHDRVLTLRYKGGEQRVEVPNGVPIVLLSPSSRSAISRGAHVSFDATKLPDGTYTSHRITVGVNGLVPPL